MAEASPSFFWNELLTADPQRAMAFYGKSLGWSFEAFEGKRGATLVAVSPKDGKKLGEMKQVPDVEAAVQSMERAGAQVLHPVHEVEGVGRAALVGDAAGAHLGLITPEK